MDLLILLSILQVDGWISFTGRKKQIIHLKNTPPILRQLNIFQKHFESPIVLSSIAIRLLK